jgi:hypothetical protein
MQTTGIVQTARKSRADNLLPVQATVHRFDPGTRSGSVVTDDGLLLPFDAEAFGGSRLRHVRTGQRLTVVTDGVGREARVVAMSLGTVGLPPARPSHP